MKKYILTTAIAALTSILGGCTHIVYQPVDLENNSTHGTPVATRMSASDESFRFLGLGTEPSTKRAFDKLYANASMTGFTISGNNYAFQNILVEKKYSFLYPILGTSAITVCADLYAYENHGVQESKEDDEK